MDGRPSEIPSSGINPEGKKGRVTTGQWEHLLHTAVVGTGIFPQAYFAQGVRLAHDMAGLSRTSSLPISAFFEEDPPSGLIRTMMDPARIKAHAAYGFQTRSEVDDNGLSYSWRREKQYARYVLSKFAGFILGKESSTDSDINNLVANPGFQGLLKEAFDALNTDEVRAISNDYKALIREFMQKYAGKKIRVYSDEHAAYKRDHSLLMPELVNRIGQASSLVATALHDGPTAALLSDEGRSGLVHVFGWPEVTPIDPLLLLDY